MGLALDPGRPALLQERRHPFAFVLGSAAQTEVCRLDDLPVARTEDLVAISAGVTRTLDENWLLGLRYQFSDNDSSDPVFSYERNVITIGVLRIF